jgi:hypothetical protein
VILDGHLLVLSLPTHFKKIRGTAINLGIGPKGRARKRVSWATLTGDSPSTHSAREVQVLRPHCVGEWEGELGADFTVVSAPRLVTIAISGSLAGYGKPRDTPGAASTVSEKFRL